VNLEPAKAAEFARGIAAYSREQAVLLRLLRKTGGFTPEQFDKWFRGREWRRPVRFAPMTGDTFILGLGRNGGNHWARMLELLQYMMALGLVGTTKEQGGSFRYFALTPGGQHD
jgi:hypothetical protein